MNLDPGARALARALFLSMSLHGAMLLLMPGAPPGTVGALFPLARLSVRFEAHRAPDVPVPDGPVAVPPAVVAPAAGGLVQPKIAAPVVVPASRMPESPSPPTGSEIVPDELLTVRPRPLNLGRLDSPEFRSLPAGGRVVLELTVRRNGRASNVRVAYNDLPGPILAHVMNMFAHARYEPGEVAGAAVDALLRVEVAVTDGSASVLGGDPPLPARRSGQE